MVHKRTIPRICDACGADFLAFATKPLGRFCSRTCFRVGIRRPAPFTLSDDGLTALIPLRARDGSTRAHALIDAADITEVGQWSWSLNDHGYVARGLMGGGTVRLHRELLGLVTGDGISVDHINRDRLDNRRANLRIATRPENNQNVPSRHGASSPHRGVSWDTRRGKWQAHVRVGGKSIALGRFKSEEEAVAAARAGRRKHLPYAVD